jgi:uncharacterized alkaline shock family protein YloU
VKKSFSGYLVDPLRLFRRGARQEEQVIEKSMVRPTFSALGRFFISDTVIGAIAERACADVDGVEGAQRAVVEVGTAGVSVAVDVAVRYGAFLPAVLAAAQSQICAAIEQMTALNVVRADVVARRVVIVPEMGAEAAAGGASRGAGAESGAGAAAEAPLPIPAPESRLVPDPKGPGRARGEA